MKRIVICCDGTWKRLDSALPTNVVRLAQAVSPAGADGTEQIVYHLDGVGTGRGTGLIARALDRALGGAFGQGLMGTIEAAYRFLIFNHAPGDEIYLFGFSRGAFCARSLAGLIRNCGILDRTAVAAIPEALALYQGRGETSHPDSNAAVAFRRRFAQRAHTSPADRAARPDAEEPLRIAYLGVWDTVGALGMPAWSRLSASLNRPLGFHDTRLSKGVAAARHAVAIDEWRRSFPPTLWDNLAALNLEAGARRYAQMWFPGDHGSVGGGGARALSDGALLWIAEGAAEMGLALDPERLGEWRRGCDPLGPLRSSATRSLIDILLEVAPAERAGPSSASEVADAALRRFRSDASYRPRALRRLFETPREAGFARAAPA